MDSMSIKTVLLKAAEIINQQGKFVPKVHSTQPTARSDGPQCIITAINRAALNINCDTWKAQGEVFKVLPNDVQYLSHWSDTHSAREVIEALTQAANNQP